MDDRESVLAANDHFYRAIESLDLAVMEEVWVHESWVRCIHPGWDVLVGWDAVRRSWETIFTNTEWMRVVPTDLKVTLFGEIGVVGCSENLTAAEDGEVGVAMAQATNVYRRTGQGWRLILHHASPAPVRVTQPFTGHVQ